MTGNKTIIFFVTFVRAKVTQKHAPNSQPAVSLNIFSNLAFATTHIASNVQTLANLIPNLQKYFGESKGVLKCHFEREERPELSC
jgi:hypothetical protein